MDENNIPIDIHAHKLLDWLVSRRHASKDWMKPLTEIRGKIRSALEDMPEHEGIARLLSSGAQLNYFTCKQIFEMLKQTEADSKNIFGYYSSQRMKDWQEILSLYEKNNVYLADAAQIIHRNVSFEVPSLKKQLSKLDSLYEDLVKQEHEAVKKSQRLLSERAKDMEFLGISKEGDPLAQISAKMDLLPEKLKEIESSLKKLDDVNLYYHDFVVATQGIDRETCPSLRHIISKGNTTYFEYLRGFKPDQVILETSSGVIAEKPEEDVIDFGDEEGGGIDFGDTEVSSSTSNGNGSSNSDGFVHVNESDAGSSRKESVDEIDFGDDAPIDVSTETAVDSSDRIARGKEAMTVLQNRKIRDLLVHELFELEGFFSQRIFETSLSDFNFLEVTMSSLLSSFQHQNLSDYLSRVQHALNQISDERLKVLFQMQDNPHFIDTLVKKLKLKQDLSEKSLSKSQELKEKQKAVLLEKQKIAQQIPSLISSTRRLEQLLEEAISSKYKNRPVNIMAGAQAM